MTVRVVTWLAVLASCREPTAGEIAGTWVISSTTLEPDVTLLRDRGGMTVRGDLEIVADGDGLALDIRQVLLDHAVMMSAAPHFEATVAVEPGTWVLRQPGGTTVYDTALDGDHLVLTYDAGDPRNTAKAAPLELVLDRVPPWTTELAGTWHVVGDPCTPAGDGARSVATDIAIDRRGIVERDTTTTRYADAACAAPTSATTVTQVGYAEESAPQLRLWLLENVLPEYYQELAFTVVDDVATWTREACLPLPECEDFVPPTLVLRR